MPNLSDLSTEDLLALRQQLAGQRMDLQQRIVDVSRQKGVDPALSLAVAHTESLFDPEATSPTGVKGLFQVTVPTGQRYGQTAQNRTDPDVSINAGVSELKRLLDTNRGNVRQALAGYGDPNQGNYPDLVLAQYPRYAQMVGQGQAPPSLKDMSTEDLLRLREQLRGPAKPAPPPSSMGTEPARMENAQGQRLRAQPGARPATPDEQRFAPQVTPPPGPVQGKTPTPVGTYRAAVAEVQPLQTAAALQTPQRQFDPRTMDDDAILQRLGVNADLVKQSRFYKPGMFQNALVTPESTGEWLMRGPVGSVLAGVRAPLAAAEQLAARGLAKIGITSDADTAFTDAMVALKRREFEQTPRQKLDVPLLGPVDPAEAAGQMLVPMPGVGMLPKVEAAAPLIKRVAGRVLNAATSGTIGGVLQPVYQPGTPGTADDTFLQQKGQQALLGAGTGAALGGVASLPDVARSGLAYTRAGQAVRQAQAETAQQAAEYLAQYNTKQAAAQQTWETQRQAEQQRFAGTMEMRAGEHQKALERFQQAQEVRTARHAARVLKAEEDYRAAQQATDDAYAQKGTQAYDDAVRRLRESYATFETETKAFRDAHAAQDAAVKRAQALPGRYAPSTSADTLYEALRAEHAETPITVTRAQEMADKVQGQIDWSMPSQQPTRMQRVVTDMLQWNEQTPFTEVHQALKDLRPLTQSSDGKTRGIAKQLRNGLFQSLEESADVFPEASGARAQLFEANRTFGQEEAVKDLQRILTPGRQVLSHQQGKLTLNADSLLNQVERHIADDPYFARSVDLNALRNDLQSFVGTPTRPTKTPTLTTTTELKDIGSRPDVTQKEIPPLTPREPPRLRIAQAPVGTSPPSPGPYTPPAEVEPGLKWQPFLKRQGFEGGAAITAAFMNPTLAKAIAAFGGIDALGFFLSKAMLSPQLRPMLLQAMGPRGEITPQVLGKLAAAMQIPLNEAEKRKTPLPVGVK